MNDTICAIATPYGTGGVAIIKISGPKSLEIVSKIFKNFPKNIESHRLYYGYIVNPETKEEIDEVLVSVMLSPKSYTREDVVEINCHGGVLIAQEILEILISLGCRLAEPGEFTKRAFLNGRIDLTQAEAVINLINAKNKIALKISEKQLKGFLTNKINSIKEKLSNILAYIESNIDFDEDTDDININFFKKDFINLTNEIKYLISSYDNVKNFFEGINIVIAGKPNVGKSSLLNFLLKKDRAIISDIPGTTRDTIEEDLFIEGIPVKLIDTAGVRETDDIIEKEGVKRAIEKIKNADIVIYMFDITEGLSDFDQKIIDKINDDRIFIVGNKVDLRQDKEINTNNDYILISLKKKINLDVFEKKLKNFLIKQNRFSDEIAITNMRQYNHLKKAYDKLKEIIQNYEQLIGMDALAFDIREILDYLGSITGEVLTEDILDKIFNQFCIGK